MRGYIIFRVQLLCVISEVVHMIQKTGLTIPTWHNHDNYNIIIAEKVSRKRQLVIDKVRTEEGEPKNNEKKTIPVSLETYKYPSFPMFGINVRSVFIHRYHQHEILQGKYTLTFKTIFKNQFFQLF